MTETGKRSLVMKTSEGEFLKVSLPLTRDELERLPPEWRAKVTEIVKAAEELGWLSG